MIDRIADANARSGVNPDEKRPRDRVKIRPCFSSVSTVSSVVQGFPFPE
jgi:hypothetical protein